jgi:hypothetical protein
MSKKPQLIAYTVKNRERGKDGDRRRRGLVTRRQAAVPSTYLAGR